MKSAKTSIMSCCTLKSSGTKVQRRVYLIHQSHNKSSKASLNNIQGKITPYRYIINRSNKHLVINTKLSLIHYCFMKTEQLTKELLIYIQHQWLPWLQTIMVIHSLQIHSYLISGIA